VSVTQLSQVPAGVWFRFSRREESKRTAMYCWGDCQYSYFEKDDRLSPPTKGLASVEVSLCSPEWSDHFNSIAFDADSKIKLRTKRTLKSGKLCPYDEILRARRYQRYRS